jgi:hypothetical protein
MPISEFTGEELDASSEAYRHECEVRWLLDGCDLQQRREIVNGVMGGLKGDVVLKKGIRQYRGNAAADRIIEDLRRLHALRLERAKTAQTT